MTPEDKIGPVRAKPIALPPWLVVVLALILYGLTLNHWVALRSVGFMAQITGWDWHPISMEWRRQEMAPLYLLATAPVRILPVAWQPVALNLFSAICAALTLGLLARSVQLWPHDRTREQRVREELGPNALLCVRAAFLPALFAVAVLATQLTFWQHAVAASDEMLNLLAFAFVIYCLLIYRVSQNVNWLLASAFVYGLAAANNWAMLGFFPFYLLALLANRGLFGFFRGKFLARMFLCGAAGLLLYLLIPLMGAFQGGGDDMWSLLRQELGDQAYRLRLIPRWVALMAAVPTILPLFFAAVRWPSFEGEMSPMGLKLTRDMFSLLHIACLLMALATFVDFKYSPSVHMRDQPASFLTFYYMAALGVGYFSGFILLVYGPSRLQVWEKRHPLQQLFYFALTAMVWVLAIGVPVVLVWQSFPRINAENNHALRQYADLTLDSLPAKKAIVLSDDPARLYLLQADAQRRGARNQQILIDTSEFPHREYILDLIARYPEFKSLVTTNLARLPKVLSSENLMQFMYHATTNYPVYYLHPSFGYYFEALYLKPQGLIYELKRYATNTTQPPVATAEEIKSNEAFWTRMENGPLKSLPTLAELSVDAAAVDVDYSLALNYWGTELQKANHLVEAHHQFTEAILLNTNNFIAQINKEYNEQLQRGNHQPIDSTRTLEKAIFLYRGLIPLLQRNGPADEPGLGLLLGQAMAEGGNLVQAKLFFQRRLQLLPGDPEAELAMAKTYVDLRQPDKSLALLRGLEHSTNVSAWEVSRCKAAAYVANQDFATAEKVLIAAVKADPDDENRLASLADYYRVMALEDERQQKPAEARASFAKALTNVVLQLQVLASPKHSTMAEFEVIPTLLKKAELEMSLHLFEAAVGTLTQVLAVEPKNYTALLNRALGQMQLHQFRAANDDLKEMRKLLPKQAYLAEFYMADVAAADRNSADEIDHLERCIRDAPKDCPEYQRAAKRLNELRSH